MTQYGDVRDVYIPTDYHTQQPRGFAFVEFFDERDASDALYNLNGYRLDGRELSIVFAKDKRKTPEQMRLVVGDGRGRRGGSRGRDDRSRSRSRDRDGDRDRDRDERRRSVSSTRYL